MTELSATEAAQGEIAPAHLAEVTRAVLPYLGTYSITAVKRASKGCDNLDTLCELVASQITESDKRERFAETARALVQRLKDPNAAAAQAIEAYIAQMQLNAAGLAVKFDGSTGTVTVMGLAPDQETREKIVLCCGNVSGVSHVDDQMTVDTPVDESQYYMVVKGDTLTKVAREFYGNANAYMPIFEANRPMLSHPDKIYPGQMLRIPKRG
jgi:hypothetical protein